MRFTDVVAQLRRLGVRRGGVLVVHSSYRAVRPVAGGPAGLIRALQAALGREGTLVMPSWSGSDQELFDPARTAAAEDLGVVPDTFWRMPGVWRSEHAFAFAAAGPRAAEIVAGKLPLPPHIPDSPIGRVRDLDGRVLLLGVDHDADTTLHLAEILAGVPYGVPKQCLARVDGRVQRVDYRENDHCCQRFTLVGGWLRERGLQAEGAVGSAYARLARSRDIVAVALEHLAADPLIFLHGPQDSCGECDDARSSVRRQLPS